MAFVLARTIPFTRRRSFRQKAAIPGFVLLCWSSSASFILCSSTSVAQDLRPPAQVAGSWTIYAYNIDRPGSSLKTVQLVQQGNILSGTFHGPHQHGKLQGWISENHVEFSTDTRQVLTFRGQVNEQGIRHGEGR